MTPFILAIFALTYIGMALGRFPGLKLDRSGIAMIAAVVLVAAGAAPPAHLAAAIHFPTLLLLAGLMILSARFGAAGFYDAAATWIARRAARPLPLLALTIAVGGVLSAVLVNDIVAFAMTPLLCAGLGARRLDPRPFLLGLAAASNAGSAATLIGNPQNILIGEVGGLGFWSFLLACAVPAIAALALTFAVVALVWRRELAAAPQPATLDAPGVDRPQLAISAAALVVLLGLFMTPMPRPLTTLLVAAVLLVSRKLPSRRIFDEIDLPLLILFAGLFVVNDALAGTGLTEAAVRWLTGHGLLPDRMAIMAPLALLVSNTIGNVPAVVLILKAWHGIPEGTLIGLALLSTLAGNLFLVGSFANLIVAERAAAGGYRLSFLDHARAGVPVTVLSMAVAGGWLVLGGWMPL